jgi:hypothetical protein
MYRVAAVCLLAVAAAACARVERQPVPASLASQAAIPGLAHARFWGDEVPKDIYAFVQTHMPGVKRMASRTAQEKGRPLVEYLALSGGADDGAFGAGLLVGWSKRGDRPNFEVVTGVSAGALIAPTFSSDPATTPSLPSCGPLSMRVPWRRRRSWPDCSVPRRSPTPRPCAISSQVTSTGGCSARLRMSIATAAFS